MSHVLTAVDEVLEQLGLGSACQPVTGRAHRR